MTTHYGKSKFLRQKQSTKSGIEDNTAEGEELKKYNDLIDKLNNYNNKSRKSKQSSLYTNTNIGGQSSGNNKSSYMRRTASRTKEVINDRDFLFMKNDTMPISPKKMHLLTDNDTNQSISDETKFKNLADLMIDDKETVVENHFIRNVEEKMILKLYTALSRKSRDIFMDENHEEQDKSRLLLHKLNNIKIPKYEISEPSPNPNKTNNFSSDSNSDSFTYKNINDGNKSQNKNSSFNEEQEKEVDSNKEKEKDTDTKKEGNKNLEFDKNCKYNKKNKNNTIKIPTLEKYNPEKEKYPSRSFHRNNPLDSWEPEVDSDFLAYINHNIIIIEDIYNKGKESTLNKNIKLKEEEIKPIEAKEIQYNVDSNNSLSSNDYDKKDDRNKSMDINQKKELKKIDEDENNANINDNDNENKINNKFCDFKDKHTNLIEISLAVDQKMHKQNVFHDELKDYYYSKINEVGELSEEMFPQNGIDLKNIKIYRFVRNNKNNKEEFVESFTIHSTRPVSVPPSPKNKKKPKKSKQTNQIKFLEDRHFSKRSEDYENEKLNNNVSKKESEKVINKEIKKLGQNKDKNKEQVNEIGNVSIDNNNIEKSFSLIIDKQSFSDNSNKIFYDSKSEHNNNNNDNSNIINNENIVNQNNNEIKFNKEEDKNNNIIKINHIYNKQNNNEENKEENKFDNNSNLSNEDNKSNILNLSASRNSGDSSIQ